MGLAGPRAPESSSLISSKDPVDEGSARRRSSRGDPLPPVSGEPGDKPSKRPTWMGLRMPSRPSFLTNLNTRLRKASARSPRAPFEDKTKGTSNALRARVAASVRGCRTFLISTSRRRAKTRLRMSSPRLRIAESPVRQVTNASTRTHTPEGSKPNSSARQVWRCPGAC